MHVCVCVCAYFCLPMFPFQDPMCCAGDLDYDLDTEDEDFLMDMNLGIRRNQKKARRFPQNLTVM